MLRSSLPPAEFAALVARCTYQFFAGEEYESLSPRAKSTFNALAVGWAGSTDELLACARIITES